jgi:alpha-1,6-mannosyltransferase
VKPVPPEPAVTIPAAAPADLVASATARRLGITGLVAVGASFVLTAVVALLGPSLLEPALPGAAGQPPWSLAAAPSPYLVVALAAAAIMLAVAGLSFGINAAAAGWRIPVGPVVLAGIAGAVLLAFLPPFGSSDHLSYAAYGRMAITGHDPYTTTPAMLARLGDPVAKAVQDWRTSPSVYGPLAVAGQALAARIGGTSVRLIVFCLSLLNVAAFAVTGLLLHLLGRGDPGRQLRAALLWTANPLLLLVLVAGAHVDSQAIVFGVAGLAIAVTGKRRPVLAAAGAGAFIGLGFAVKVTTALIGAGLAIGVLLAWQRRREAARSTGPAKVLGGLAAGFAAVVALALTPWGTAMFGPALRAGSYTSVGSPWRAVRSGLRLLIGESAAEDLVKVASVLLAVALLILLLRYLRDTAVQLLVAGAFAVVFSWLLAWPYVLPWYDGLGWAMLVLLPASRFDWLMLARTAALAIGYLPARGVPLPAGLGWLETVVRTAITPVALAAITVLAIVWLWPGRSGRPANLAAA